MPRKLKLNKHGLTDLEEKCCHNYLRYNSNMSKAYRKSHGGTKNWKPETVHNKAYKLFTKLEVQQRIQALRDDLDERFKVGTEKIKREYAYTAFSRPGELYDENGNLLHTQDMPAHVQATVAETVTIITKGKKGEGPDIVKKVKLWNKLNALDSLARMEGMFEKDNDQRRPVFNLNAKIHPSLARLMNFEHDGQVKEKSEQADGKE